MVSIARANHSFAESVQRNVRSAYPAVSISTLVTEDETVRPSARTICFVGPSMMSNMIDLASSRLMHPSSAS